MRVSVCSFAFATLLFWLTASDSQAGLIIFSDDFNGPLSAEFSGIANTESVQGYEGFGHVGNQFSGKFLRNNGGTYDHLILTLSNLASHNSVSLSFLFAAIDTWDGSEAFGPDILNVTVDGISILSETFDTQQSGVDQSYVPPPGVLLNPRVDRGFSYMNTTDDGYDMGLDPRFSAIPHSSSTLTVEWFASGAGHEGPFNESWAIDNVRVEIETVPEPMSFAVLTIGGLGLMLVNKVRRRYRPPQRLLLSGQQEA